MRSPLNSPLEAGVRVLILLIEAHPSALDVNTLVLLDHSVLNTSDLDGPESLQPHIPIRSGGLGVKRRIIEEGLNVMLRANMAELQPAFDGIRFRASESAYSFISVLGSEYAHLLRERAKWVTAYFGELTDDRLREEMRAIYGSWAEEFASPEVDPTAGGDTE